MFVGGIEKHPEFYVFGSNIHENNFALSVFNKKDYTYHNLSIISNLGVLSFGAYYFFSDAAKIKAKVCEPKNKYAFLEVKSFQNTDSDKNLDRFNKMIDNYDEEKDLATFSGLLLSVLGSRQHFDAQFEWFKSDYKDLHAYAISEYILSHKDKCKEIISNKNLIRKMSLLKELDSKEKMIGNYSKFIEEIYKLDLQTTYSIFAEVSHYSKKQDVFTEFKTDLLQDAVNDLLNSD